MSSTTTPRQERHIYVQGWITLLVTALTTKHDVKMSFALSNSAWLKVLWVEKGDEYEINVLAHEAPVPGKVGGLAEYKALWLQKNDGAWHPPSGDWISFLDLPDEMLKSLVFQVSLLTNIDGEPTAISPDRVRDEIPGA